MATANIHIPVTTNADGTVRAVGTQLDGLARKAEQTGEKMGKAFNRAAQTQKTVIEEGIGRWTKAMGMGAAVWGTVARVQSGWGNAQAAAQQRADAAVAAEKQDDLEALRKQRRAAEQRWTSRDLARQSENERLTEEQRRVRTIGSLHLAGLNAAQAKSIMGRVGSDAASHSLMQQQAEQMGRLGMSGADTEAALIRLADALNKFSAIPGFTERLGELSANKDLAKRKDLGDIAFASLLKGSRMDRDKESAWVADLIAGRGVADLAASIPQRRGETIQTTGSIGGNPFQETFTVADPWRWATDLQYRDKYARARQRGLPFNAQSDKEARDAEMEGLDERARAIGDRQAPTATPNWADIGREMGHAMAPVIIGIAASAASSAIMARSMMPGGPVPAPVGPVASGGGGLAGTLARGLTWGLRVAAPVLTAAAGVLDSGAAGSTDPADADALMRQQMADERALMERQTKALESIDTKLTRGPAVTP